MVQGKRRHRISNMERMKPEDGLSLGGMGISEEEKKQARNAVITNVAAFVAIVVALRLGNGSY